VCRAPGSLSSRLRAPTVAYHCQVTDEQPISRRAAREAAAPARRGSRQRPPRNDQGPDADGTRPRGIGALFAKHPTAWLMGAIAVVFVLLGTGAVFAGVSVGSASAAGPAASATPEPPRAVPAGELAASRLRTCSIRSVARDPRLSQLHAYVARGDTGEVLFDRRGDVPARTASVLKLFTAAAALSVLGPDFRVTTSVLPGSAPGSIVFVGRGDATLSALPPGQESVYRGAPKLADLAQQTLAAYSGPQITSIILDASYWSSADKWHPSWARSEQTIGYHSEVTALQVDGDRANPTQVTSPRSTDPIGRAGRLFLEALRAADTEGKVADEVSFSTGTATGGSPLAEVKSQPMSQWIDYMLLVSDNTLAEMLARITSKESALDGSAASLQQAIPSALVDFNISGADLVIKDGSGLSHENAVPASAIAQLLLAMQAGGKDLDVIRAGLPVAGETGTLASRFTGSNSVARGQVFAKTGWIDTAYSLAGLVKAEDGTVLVFVFYAIRGDIESNAREALDTLTTAVYKCGDNLSNN
jgi:D-alanyl-D-alanine carboxypeptidase/D-alanyl-D-alanine-endopeptidase (penicillin-binding protein 4)